MKRLPAYGAFLVLSFLCLPQALASVIAGSPESVAAKIARFEKTSVYFELPGGERVKVDNEFIVHNLSTDSTGTGARIKTSLHINTPQVLSDIAARAGKSTLVPEPATLHLHETSTGVTLPDTGMPLGYSIRYDLLEEVLVQRLMADKATPAIIKIPAIAVDPTVVLDHMDGTQENLDIVSHGISDFHGSTDARIFNIKTAVEHFQGARINPGATFSFNELLGVVDGSTGYKKELVIKGDKTIPDYGGGVCQVSSTLFRSALQAGFPIVERRPHSYAVSYYSPWGTDATVYPGVVDLKFTNDLPSPVYLQYIIEGTQLHALLYGKKDGRTVTMSGPNTYAYVAAPDPDVEYVSTLPPGKRVWKEYGHNGFSAWWERTITSSTGAVMSEKIISTYEPRGGSVIEGAAGEVPLPE